MDDSDLNAPLGPEHLPASDADWGEIVAFGLTFGGCEHARSRWPERDGSRTCPELCGRVRAALTRDGSGRGELTVDDLRAALYCELRVARRTRWDWETCPEAETLAYSRRLIECIRARVTKPSPEEAI